MIHQKIIQQVLYYNSTTWSTTTILHEVLQRYYMRYYNNYYNYNFSLHSPTWSTTAVLHFIFQNYWCHLRVAIHAFTLDLGFIVIKHKDNLISYIVVMLYCFALYMYYILAVIIITIQDIYHHNMYIACRCRRIMCSTSIQMYMYKCTRTNVHVQMYMYRALDTICGLIYQRFHTWLGSHTSESCKLLTHLYVLGGGGAC